MVRNFKTEDSEILVEMFCRNLETFKDYISHGEIQMGLSSDGVNLSSDYKEKWRRYLSRHNDDPKSHIYVFENENVIEGFIIFGIENDYDKEYGVIYDILVSDSRKGAGIGNQLFKYAIDIYKSLNITDCYLESGINNHGAHAFFEKKGFKHISNIYRLRGL